MSTCKKCNCTQPCGCKDTALTTVPLYQDSTTCPSPQVCSEFIYSGCIIYNGPELCQFNISPGMTLNQVLQAITMLSIDPGCMNTTAHAPFVQINGITVSTITVGWVIVPDAISYLVSYLDESQSPAVWVDSSVLTSLTMSYVITGLDCGTIYQVKVTATFDENDPPTQCESLIICVTTLDC